MKKIITIKANHIVGVIILLINLCWIYFWAELFYEYHFTNILFLIMLPNWLLVLEMIIGILGILVGMQLICNKLKMKYAIPMAVVLWLIGIGVEFFSCVVFI